MQRLFEYDMHIGDFRVLVQTKDIRDKAVTLEKLSPEVFTKMIIASGAVAIGPDGYWYVDGMKTGVKAQGEPGRDGLDGKDGKDGVNGRDGHDGKDGKDGIDGKTPLLKLSDNGMDILVSTDGGKTWIPLVVDFSKIRVLGYVDSVEQLPRMANVGNIYGVWNQEAQEGEGAYELYLNTVIAWNLHGDITKVYEYETELPQQATNETVVVVEERGLTLDKERIDGYKVYQYNLATNGWIMLLNTSEIYVTPDDIVNHGDNVYALVQGDTANTYKLYKRQTGWVFFGTNASITYHLIQDVNEGTETNILSGKAVKDAYGHYIESPEFLRAYLDDEDKILWGIRTDGTVYFGAGVPPQVKDYIEKKIADLSLDEYEDIVAFLDDLEKGDKTLQDLLDEKVDKEEGKSLIDEEYAEGVHYIENPEFVEVKLDQDDRILEATMLDGTKLLPAGYEVGGNVVKTISNPEYLAAWLDSSDHILFALKADGDVIFGCGVPSQIKEHVGELIEMFHYEDNPEFLSIELDSEKKILGGRSIDGTLIENIGIKTPIVNTDKLKLSKEGLDELSADLNVQSESDKLPVYYKEYIKEKVIEYNKIFSFNSESSDAFIFVTDIHCYGNQMNSPALINYIIDNTPVNKVVFGGDIPGGQGTQDNWKDVTVRELISYRRFKNTAFPKASYYPIHGNHDLNCIGDIHYDSETGGWVVTYYGGLNQYSQWNLFINDINRNIVFNENTDKKSIYYYYDNPKAKLRYIVADIAVYNGDEEFIYKISDEQIDWIASQAVLTIPNGYKIIFMMHAPLVNDLDRAYYEWNNLRELIDAIQDKTSYLSYDFSQLNTQVLAFFSGHEHFDGATYRKGVAHITTGCDTFNNDYTWSHFIANYMTRQKKDVTEQLLDIVNVDIKNNEIYCKRVGCGFDRIFHTNKVTLNIGDTYALPVNISDILEIRAFDYGSIVWNIGAPPTIPNSENISISENIVSALQAIEDVVVVAMYKDYKLEYFNFKIN